MLPEFPKFKPLEIGDLDLGNERNICELANANFFIWEDYDHIRITLINQNPCLLISPPEEKPHFLEPLGEKQLTETVKTCLKYTGKISQASEDFVFKLRQEDYRIICLRDQYDYVYSTPEMAQLKGRKFDGKRNHIKNFIRRHPEYKFIPLEAGLKKEALALFEKWYEGRKETRFFQKLAYSSQKNALEKAFKYFDRLTLVGGAIILNGVMKGFILGSKLNPETFCAHFQYVDPEIRGLSQTLLSEACQKIFSDYPYINLEQDLGIPGLRKTKLSYHPLRMERKFEITP